MAGVWATEQWICERIGLDPSRLGDVRTLSLPGVVAEKISRLGSSLMRCSRLKQLDLSNNRLTSLEGLERLTGLEKLILCENNIADVEILSALCHNTQLRELDLRGNTVTQIGGYRGLLARLLPSLQVLDGEALRENDHQNFSLFGEASVIESRPIAPSSFSSPSFNAHTEPLVLRTVHAVCQAVSSRVPSLMVDAPLQQQLSSILFQHLVDPLLAGPRTRSTLSLSPASSDGSRTGAGTAGVGVDEEWQSRHTVRGLESMNVTSVTSGGGVLPDVLRETLDQLREEHANHLKVECVEWQAAHSAAALSAAIARNKELEEDLQRERADHEHAMRIMQAQLAAVSSELTASRATCHALEKRGEERGNTAAEAATHMAAMLQETHRALMASNEALRGELVSHREMHDKEVAQLRWNFDTLLQTTRAREPAGLG